MRISRFFLTSILLCFQKLAFLQMEFRIAQQWDGAALGHAGIEIRLQPSPAGDAVVMEMNGPFFNDPGNPGGAVGKPFPNLWDYEGKR